jgi:ribonuclease P protein component
MIIQGKTIPKAKKEAFGKSLRVKKEYEFKRIIENGTKKRGGSLIVFRLLGAGVEGQKFGIKMSRGIKRAILRNKIKRVLKEVLRKNKDKFDKNEGVVVVCRCKTGQVNLRKLKEELEGLIR